MMNSMGIGGRASETGSLGLDEVDVEAVGATLFESDPLSLQAERRATSAILQSGLRMRVGNFI